MKLNINSENQPNSKLLSLLSNGLLAVVLLLLFISQISCSDNNDSTDTKKSKEQLERIAKNNEIRAARRSDATSTVKSGYVDQSKIISNGKDFGIEILAVRISAKGYMLDFRFNINDIEKAKEIMQRKVKARLIIEKNQGKLFVPVSYKLGAMRQSGNNMVANKNYFMFFANPGGAVKPGDMVTFELGGFKAEHITVN